MKKLTLTSIAAILLTSTLAFANGSTEPSPEPQPEPELHAKIEKPEPGKASGATSVNTCTTPTSVRPADYPADAKTWPCRNFSKPLNGG